MLQSALKTTQNFIAGEFCSGSSQKFFDNLSPVDGSLVSRVAEASEADVDRAVRAAHKALTGTWNTISLGERCDLIRDVANEIGRRFEDFLAAEMADTGKPHSLASVIDIPRGAANFRIFSDIVRYASEHVYHQETADGLGALNYTVRKPKGVIGVISPWNLPLLLMTWKVAPALACGNTVVAKPSEETPSTTALLGEVMNTVGIPAGVFNVVHGFGPGSAGEFLTKHPLVNAITFTGETRTGEAIMKVAATGVRDISSELGGKNASLVFADCDLDKAVAGTVRSAFTNTGQVCLCTERVYVERPIFDEFVGRLKAATEKLRFGPPGEKDTDLGPLISRKHRDKVLSYYRAAVEDGATVVTGGGVPELGDTFGEGAWIQPTIWTGLREDSRVVREEIFGPCCHIQPFDTEEDAVRMANDTQYGLAAVIWTENLGRAHRLAPKMETGIVWVNTWNLRDLRTPFGGAKQSGIGREGGLHSIEFYTETTNICIKN
ncbi:2-hydroxymuconic semialdehyde dehydrogenase [Ensifer adhaerens]|uniref:2-hydroxymuconic semialdehyde dehydrogenase n=1 Tax=Ensifer adhaerens TaxID=106592 RepID=A0A9Q8YHZ4_ENSAD|nr:2-hydroxymuconic semialdehyde dehydrogenase [Ensifer adhaerens]USJ28512.1 2-hydroxymuconic semialdehyde dehydrogenase [Ensifer adhaerens]